MWGFFIEVDHKIITKCDLEDYFFFYPMYNGQTTSCNTRGRYAALQCL